MKKIIGTVCWCLLITGVGAYGLFLSLFTPMGQEYWLRAELEKVFYVCLALGLLAGYWELLMIKGACKGSAAYGVGISAFFTACVLLYNNLCTYLGEWFYFKGNCPFTYWQVIGRDLGHGERLLFLKYPLVFLGMLVLCGLLFLCFIPWMQRKYDRFKKRFWMEDDDE